MIEEMKKLCGCKEPCFVDGQEAKDALREKIDSVKVLFEEKDSTSEST